MHQLTGSAERPRLAVFRSNEHIYAQVCGSLLTFGGLLDNASTSMFGRHQVIDDVNGHTLLSASTVGKDKKDIAGDNIVRAICASMGGLLLYELIGVDDDVLNLSFSSLM